MKLFYLFSPKTLNNLIENNSLKDKYLIVSNNLLIYEMSLNHKLNIITIDGFIDEETAKKIDDIVLEVSKTWYLKEENTLLYYRNVSIASCLSYYVVNHLANIVKLFISFQHIFASYKINKIITDYKQNSYNITCVNCFMFDKIEYIGNEGFSLSEIISDSSKYYIEEVFGSRKIEKKGKRWIYRLLFMLSSKECKENSIIAVPSNQIDKFIKTNNNKEFGYKILLPINLVNRKLITHILKYPNYLLINLFPQKYSSINKTQTRFQLNDDYLNKFDLRKISPLINDYFSELISTHYDALKLAIDKYYDFFSKSNVKLIVLPNDCITEYRALVLVGKIFDIPSLIVQHGYLGWFGDENHSVGQYSAVFSESTKEVLCEKYSLSPNDIYLFNYFV